MIIIVNTVTLWEGRRKVCHFSFLSVFKWLFLLNSLSTLLQSFFHWLDATAALGTTYFQPIPTSYSHKLVSSCAFWDTSGYYKTPFLFAPSFMIAWTYTIFKHTCSNTRLPTNLLAVQLLKEAILVRSYSCPQCPNSQFQDISNTARARKEWQQQQQKLKVTTAAIVYS